MAMAHALDPMEMKSAALVRLPVLSRKDHARFPHLMRGPEVWRLRHLLGQSMSSDEDIRGLPVLIWTTVAWFVWVAITKLLRWTVHGGLPTEQRVVDVHGRHPGHCLQVESQFRRVFPASGTVFASLLCSKARNATGRTDAGPVAARAGWGLGGDAPAPGRRPPLLGSVVSQVHDHSSTFYPTSILWRHP